LKVLLNIYSLGGLLKGIRPYCSRILLFGSCAEGLDVRDSDIDLFVLTQEKEKVKLEISAHQGETGRRIAAIVVNANEFARMKRVDRTLYDGITKGITLWESE
jgi:predicted nucleotidyltransferase